MNITEDEDGKYCVNGYDYYETREDAEEALSNLELYVHGKIASDGKITNDYDEKIGSIDDYDNGTVTYQSYSQGTDLSEVDTLEFDVVYRSIELDPPDLEY